jgi:prepilin-type N-terminal cleavage/methylation domain-containing protein
MSQARRKHDGFTIVELLVGIILVTIFSAGLYAALVSGFDIFNSQQTQGSAQADARLSTGRFTREARQAVSPGGGLSAIESLTPTEIVLYVDNSRDATAVVPKPTKVRYRLNGGNLIRESAPPQGAAAPFTYGGYVTSEIVAKGILNTPATQPIFKAVDLAGTPLPSSVTGANAATIGTITYRLILKQKTQKADSSTEITTDVTPRNR